MLLLLQHQRSHLEAASRSNLKKMKVVKGPLVILSKGNKVFICRSGPAEARLSAKVKVRCKGDNTFVDFWWYQRSRSNVKPKVNVKCIGPRLIQSWLYYVKGDTGKMHYSLNLFLS